MAKRHLVIVGAGPAGTTAAFFHKRADPHADVLLIDRLGGGRYEKYHRMCGEAISQAAFQDLRPLRPTHVVHDISRFRERWPGGKEITARTQGYILDRPAFLRGIVDQFVSMGGELVEDAVENVSVETQDITLELTSGTKVQAVNVIAADGAHSVIRRNVFGSDPPIMLWTEQYLVPSKVPEDTITFIQGERYKGGYRWEFPAREGSRVGFPRGTDPTPEDATEVHRRAIPMGGVPEVVKGRVYLAGDAGAMTNPLTSGGIRVAMLSGRKAAEAVLSDDPASYQRWWDSSPFASPLYLKAFRKLEKMTDADYAAAAKGFQPNPLAVYWLCIVRPEYRDIYRAYIPSSRFGW